VGNGLKAEKFKSDSDTGGMKNVSIKTKASTRTATGCNLEVPVQINGIDINAIVDTASMLTLISKRFLYSIPGERRYGERVSLRNFTGGKIVWALC